MIMPLASRRDKVTQVRWGLEDFRARFGREPEGMWLPETAVDNETLEVLAEAGIKFTILAPHQAARVRRLGAEAWDEVGERDRSQPRLPLARPARPDARALLLRRADLAGHRLRGRCSSRGERLVARLLGRLRRRRARGRSSCTARPTASPTATTAASARWRWPPRSRTIEAGGHVDAHQLRRVPGRAPARPTRSQIRERTSWSCAHGVERWRSDCGCRMRPDSQQRWRAPLRDALDWLRDQIDAFYEARASAPPQGPVGGARRLHRRGPRSRAPDRPRRVPGRAPARSRSTPTPRWRRAGCSRCSAIGCSCTPPAAGSSTRSRGWSPCRS